ncbi:MAG: phosphoribosylformylglycinamidine synthase I [Pirellulaceae bacterium]
MPTPRVLILRAPGTNCDHETAFAFERAGGRSDLVHINRLLENPRLPDDYQVLCLPGGFSYGDDIAAGRILANQIRHHLQETLQTFKTAEKLILGICNGFQILIKSGVLLPDNPESGPTATLAWNDSGKFEDRWVQLVADAPQCVFLRGIERMYLPVAHAEGKFVVRNKQILPELQSRHQLALRYCRDEATKEDAMLPFPLNPNGSVANVAGICDDTGRVLGMMPHPERYIDPTHHPRWTRGEARDPGDGLAVFRNAVEYFSA